IDWSEPEAKAKEARPSLTLQALMMMRRNFPMKRWLLSIALVLFGFAAGSALWLRGQQNPQAVLPREFTSYRDVVKRVLPAVVSIDTRAKPGARAVENLPEEFRRPPADPNRLGFGSGFIADPTGVVVTNYHVVEGAETA